MAGGYLIPRPGTVRPPVSGNLDALDTRQGNFIVRLPPVAGVSGSARRTSRKRATRVRSGYLTESPLSRFYNRIAVIPSTVTLGAVSSAQVVTVKVWNAWLMPQTLLSVSVSGGDGIAVTGPDVPRRFNRLALYEWRVTVSPDGPDEINCVITWQFAGLPAVTCTLTGARSVPWLMVPDWGDGITETLEWKTDMLRSQTGASQRVARRLSPRRMFEFKVLAGGAARRRLEQQLFTYGSRVWSLPVWPDIAVLSAPVNAGSLTMDVPTDGRDFVPGGLALLCTDDLITGERESVEISAVEADRLILARATQQYWSAGCRVHPLRSARLTDPAKITRKSDGVIAAQIRFQVTGHNDYHGEHGLTLYRGHPVLEPSSDWNDDLSAEYSRLMAELDNATGTPYHLDTAGRPFVVQTHGWLLVGREEQARLRSLLYYLRGRQRPVWVGSQSTDLVVVADITGAVLDVEYAGFSDDGPAPGRRDLRIETDSGIYYVRVTGAVKLSATTERLALDALLNITQSRILKISWLTLCILNSDSVSWEHKTDADGVASLTLTFEGVRDELE